MMIMTMMGLTPGLMVHAFFLFALTIPLVMFMAWILEFFLIGIESNCDIIPLFVFVPIRVDSKVGQLIEIFWRPKF